MLLLKSMATWYDLPRFFTPGDTAPSPHEVGTGTPIVDVYCGAQLSELRTGAPGVELDTSSVLPRLHLSKALGRITFGSVDRDGAFVPSQRGGFTALVSGVYEGSCGFQPLIIEVPETRQD